MAGDLENINDYQPTRPGQPGSSGGPRFPGGKDNYMVGMKDFMARLNIEMRNLQNGSVRGMVLAANLIRHETEHKAPTTPLRLGNLRASWFIVSAERVNAGRRPKFVNDPRPSGMKASQFMAEHSAALAEQRNRAKTQEAENRRIVIMGYSANYAGFLHESIVVKRLTQHPRRPAPGLKWFETHFKANKDKVLKQIASEVKIK